jgi:hypothetical protein
MKTEIKWGVIFIVVQLVWSVLLQVLGIHDQRIAWHPYVTMLFFFPAVAMYVFALREKRAVLGGKMSYKEGCISGLLVTLVVTLLSPLAQWIFHYVIAKNYFKNVIDYSVKAGLMTLEAAQANFNFNSYLLQSAVGALIAGILTTLIVAAFVRTKNT